MNTSKASLRTGFTLVEIMIVVAIIGLLGAIAIPSYVHTRARTQATACINNLRQIESAVQQVVFEKGKHDGETITWPDDVTPYIKLNSSSSIPCCPAGGRLQSADCGHDSTGGLFARRNSYPPHILQ